MPKNPCDSLDDYLDDMLDHQARTNYELHVTTCAECASALHLQMELDTALRKYSKTLDSPSARGNVGQKDRPEVAVNSLTSKCQAPTALGPKNRSFERQALVAVLATVAAAICVAAWLPSRSLITETSNRRDVNVIPSSESNTPSPNLELANLDEPSDSSSLRTEWIEVGNRSHLELASAAEARPIVRSIECDGHVTVHAPVHDDELTFVMLYPKVSFQPQENANAN